MQIWELAKWRKVWNIECTELENGGNLLIFQVEKFQKIPKFYNFDNHQIFIIDKFIK